MSKYVEVISLGERYKVNVEHISLIQSTDGGRSCTLYVVGYPNALMLDTSYEDAVRLVMSQVCEA
ncbi:hypothetical protein [Parabacteroides pacaensis]|uniref:hypothetical protein n=1 Tax=Parabacteroides pacaensis TaxID=2086575 RepID=UPI000D0E4102|nr:hypothetical protein [Parabacteroides pacaensis]